jgi:hypothetical protein
MSASKKNKRHNEVSEFLELSMRRCEEGDASCVHAITQDEFNRLQGEETDR